MSALRKRQGKEEQNIPKWQTAFSLLRGIERAMLVTLVESPGSVSVKDGHWDLPSRSPEMAWPYLTEKFRALFTTRGSNREKAPPPEVGLFDIETVQRCGKLSRMLGRVLVARY
jgi:hypothetical protein